MAEYIIGKAVVRIHGEVDQKRIEQACLAYLEHINQPTTPHNQGGQKNGIQHNQH